MVLALMMPSIVQATEIVATSEAEVSTDKMAEETSEKAEVSSEKLPVEDENQQAEPDIKEEIKSNDEEDLANKETSGVSEDNIHTKKIESESMEPKSEVVPAFDLVTAIDNLIIGIQGSEGIALATVIGYNGTGGSVVIPATVLPAYWSSPVPVREIGQDALANKNIDHVIIPVGVTGIGDRAFFNNNLQTVDIPASVQHIGTDAFSFNALESLTLLPNVFRIMSGAFSHNELTKIEFKGAAPSTLGEGAFSYNPLEYIEVVTDHLNTFKNRLAPNVLPSVSSEGRVILRALDYLTGTGRERKVRVGDDISYEISQQYQTNDTYDRIWQEYIPEVQWSKNEIVLSERTEPLLKLESVAINDSGVYHAVVDGERFPNLILDVEKAEFEFIFSGSNGDSTATLVGYNGDGGDVVIPSEAVNTEADWDEPSPVTVIGSNAFYGKQLTNVNVPDGVTSLGVFAFYDNQLTNVELPDTITNMGSYAFANNRITHVNIPKNLTVLEDHVFLGNNLTNVTLPEGIISIGNNAFALNELTDIYIPDSVTSFGAGVFRGSPLRYIETNRDNLLNLRNMLDPSVVLTNVTETTVLRALEYTEETEINSEVVIGSYVHYKISDQYRISAVDDLVWTLHFPTVYWFKDDIQIADRMGNDIVIQDLQESDSGIYKAIVDGTPFPDLQLEVIPEIEPEIPAIDPSEPPASPENVNPDVAGLSIRYASDIHFKSAPFSVSDQDLFLDTQENQPMVTIQDMRPKSERSGWELLVSQDTSFMNGAEIVMNPFIHQANQDNLLIDPSSELVLNDAPQRFTGTTTNQSNPFGIVSMGMESEGKPMRLRVPGKTGVNSYETTVHWQLVTGP
ncbi:leucine-rich repeat protein [Enterococcus thailandicus]